MELNVRKVSSRGQVVIPREIREELGITEGEGLLVFRVGNSIILKSASGVTGRSEADLEAIRKKVRKLKITRREVELEIGKTRSDRKKPAA